MDRSPMLRRVEARQEDSFPVWQRVMIVAVLGVALIFGRRVMATIDHLPFLWWSVTILAILAALFGWFLHRRAHDRHMTIGEYLCYLVYATQRGWK